MQFLRLTTALAALVCCGASHGQTLIAPFDAHYSFIDLGTPQGVLLPLGGLYIRSDDPNTLLLGGAANQIGAQIYKVPLVRGGDGHIVSFGARRPTILAAAPGIDFGGIDGGLALGPGNVLFYAAYSGNDIGQIKAGSAAPDLLTDITSLGVLSSVGALAFVPSGFPNAGKLKVASYNQNVWYTMTLTPNGSGTFALSAATNPVPINGGPEGILFVEAGNPAFAVNSVLISRYGAASIAAYDLDANSDPILATERLFMTNVAGAEGAARDPVTGDYLFSTYSGANRVLVVRGFAVACPADLSGDGTVGAEDLALLLGDWASTSSPADLDANGSVGASDLAVLLGAWGPC